MVTVSYVLLGGYAAFVVGSSLLVGLLPALVDLPECDPDETTTTTATTGAPNLRLANNPSIFMQDKFEPMPANTERESKTTKKSKRDTRPVLDRIESFKQAHPNKLNEQFYQRHTPKIFDDLTICSEILNPQPGIRYPWYNDRLPNTTIPKNYDIELFVPTWDMEIYDGFIEIEMEITKATNYFLLHSKADIPIVWDFKDKDGNTLPLTCVGEFFYNDYYILKTSRDIQPSESPLKLSFVFIGFLPDYETGLFEIEYTNGLPGEEEKT